MVLLLMPFALVMSIPPLVRNQLQDLATTRNVPLENVLEDVIYPLVPQKRLLQVQEIADYAMFLASEKAKGITGQAVVIDGGYTAQKIKFAQKSKLYFYSRVSFVL